MPAVPPAAAPRVSLITPVFDPPLGALLACIDSVRSQSYTDWEWCLVDDCSTRPEVWDALCAAAATDPRLRVVRRATNGGIVAASNDALEMARGEFVALLDHDDTLTDGALASVMTVLDGPGGTEIDYLYTDEAHALADGREAAHFLKPDWSPERFRSSMYTCHLSVLRRSLVESIGRFRVGFDGSQDHDLVLRATERITASGRRIVHLPVLAYRWRNVSSSVSRAAGTVTTAVENGRRAVQEHCDRTGIAATVVHGPVAGTYRCVRIAPPQTTATIVVASRLEGAEQRPYRLAVASTLRSLATSIADAARYTCVVVAHPADAPGALVELLDAELQAAERARGGADGAVRFDRVAVPGGWSVATAIDTALVAYPADVVLSVAPGVVPRRDVTSDWLEAMVGSAAEPGVGVVGAAITDTAGFVLHAGWDVPDYRWYELVGLRADATTSGNDLLIERECTHVSFAAAAFTSGSWREGRHQLRGDGWNTAGREFSAAVAAGGARVIWTPHARFERAVAIDW